MRISRQLWWGHRIPAWYDNEGNVYVGRDEEVRRENNIAADVALRQDEDVPRYVVLFCTVDILNLRLARNTEALKTFHPTMY